MKQTTPTLKSLIRKGKFNYVNSNITEANFPTPDRFSTDYKVFHFNRYISSENAIKEMETEGYVPANIYELLNYEGKENWLVALGSVAELDGDRLVACLSRRDSGRGANLYWFDYDWGGGYRFLAVRNFKPSTTSKSDSLNLKYSDPLEKRVSDLESKVDKLTRIINI